MVMNGKQLALNEVGLHRAAQSYRHISLAHGQVQLAILEQKHDTDLRVELDEFGDARRQPDGTEADRGVNSQFPRRLVLGIHETGLRCGELGEDVVRRPIEHFALFGQNQAAGVAMKQRDADFLLESADLPAYRRLRQPELVAGMGEAAGVGDRVKDAQAVPVHGACRR